MIDEFRYIGEFLSSIVTNWVVLLGGVLMTLFEAFERFREKQVDRRHYITFVASLLFLSFYLSWRDVKVHAKPVDSPPQKFDVTDYEGRAKLDQTTKDLTKKLADAEAKITTLEETITQQNNTLKINEDLLAALPEEAKRSAEQLLERWRLPRTITPEQRTKFKAQIQGKPCTSSPWPRSAKA